MSDLVCVYGTLKRGKSNHWLMERVGTYVCDVVIEDMIMLSSDSYGFPAAIEEAGSVIYGEVYKLHHPRLLTQLDWLEGYDEDDEENSLFTRKLITTSVGQSWIYIYNEMNVEQLFVGAHTKRLEEWV